MDIRGNSKRVFDYETLAKKYNVLSKVLNEIIHDVSREYGDDYMRIGFHVVRALRSANREKLNWKFNIEMK